MISYRQADLFDKLPAPPKTTKSAGELTIDWNSNAINFKFCNISNGDIERILYNLLQDFGIAATHTGQNNGCWQYRYRMSNMQPPQIAKLVKELRAFLSTRSSKTTRPVGFDIYRIDKHFMDML